MKTLLIYTLRKSKHASKLANPPKKHIEIKAGPSANPDASGQTDHLLGTGTVLAPAPATCSPSSPAALLTQPKGPSASSPTKANPGGAWPAGWPPAVALTVHEQPSQLCPGWQGLASHQLLSTLHASRSQAEGVTGGS